MMQAHAAKNTLSSYKIKTTNEEHKRGIFKNAVLKTNLEHRGIR
jgi:hypothetical protein